MAIQPVMERRECQDLLLAGRSDLYDRVIAYLPRNTRRCGRYTSPDGEFHIFELEQTYWLNPIDDFNLWQDSYVNEYGTEVLPVHVTFDYDLYFEAFHFCRIGHLAGERPVYDIVNKLNVNLDEYESKFRTGIAQEWAAQEPWRIYPRRRQHELPLNYGRPIRLPWEEPGYNIDMVMSELLPEGYGEDHPCIQAED